MFDDFEHGNDNDNGQVTFQLVSDWLWERDYDRKKKQKNKPPPRKEWVAPVKHHRTHHIPDEKKRCVATTKTGEQCKCPRKSDSTFCSVHSRKYDMPLPLPEDDDANEETPLMANQQRNEKENKVAKDNWNKNIFVRFCRQWGCAM
jgi:hypothetical protein